MNIQQDLSQLEAFQHSDVKIPSEKEICRKLFHWMKEGDWSIKLEDVFPFMHNLSEAGQNRFRLYLVFLLNPSTDYEKRLQAIFRIVKYRSIDEVIGL